MTQDEIIEMAIQGHASTRDAIRWAMNQEREACAEICETYWNRPNNGMSTEEEVCGSVTAELIRARGQA
jgi:hypothetical protein